ncbi:hypothetical protein BJV82DRAFT_237146 [Fennellomyces sp. T-0311]|nr:hypothetical protein BJV82DRAFT_237146 [Fennellomyces sp. T-0311]
MSDSNYSDYKPFGSQVYKTPEGDRSKDLFSWEHILGNRRTFRNSLDCFNCCLGGRIVQANDTHVCGFSGLHDMPNNCTNFEPFGRFGVLANITRDSSKKEDYAIVPNCYATFSNVIIAQPFRDVKLEVEESLSYHSYTVNWTLSFLLFFCILLIQRRA